MSEKWAISFSSLDHVIGPTWHLIDDAGVRCKRRTIYVKETLTGTLPEGARKCEQCNRPHHRRHVPGNGGETAAKEN